jgi:1,4-dihydroxy-2-naphthoate octaprenyltransferase
MQVHFRNWLKAARLRTLPLALSSILLGSFIAQAHGGFNWIVFALAVFTTLFLQVLSNFANDYGDAVNGVDNENRIGPQRAIQSGAITIPQMKNAILLFALLALASGIALVWQGTLGLTFKHGFFFIVLGLMAIGAAIKYTVGKRPYGYRGLGDFFVFLFFGLAGVVGTYFLHTQVIEWDILLPASSIGFLSAGVLNLNNMRDLEEDRKVGKITLAVKLGIRYAKTYHVLLLLLALAAALLFTFRHFHSGYQFLFLLTIPMLSANIKVVLNNTQPILLDAHLKKLALSTLLFALTFGIGLLLSYQNV